MRTTDTDDPAFPGEVQTVQGPMVQREMAVRDGVARLLDDPEAVECIERLGERVVAEVEVWASGTIVTAAGNVVVDEALVRCLEAAQ